MKIVLTGGGTAGHVVPNIALLPYLEKHFSEIHYIGSVNGIEKELLKKYKNIKFHKITTVKLIRALNFNNLLIPFKLIKGISDSRKILKKIKPDIIFSKGGYVSVPVAIASRLLKIPVVAHESDFSLGLANKIIYKFCRKMCFSFNNISEKYRAKGVFTGSPIRKELLDLCKSEPSNKKNLLFIGGSLGAKAINEFVFNNINKFVKDYNIVHITGKGKINTSLKNIENYTQIEFTNEIGKYFNEASIIISRAGSNTIFELLAISKPMILIPLPSKESRGDQIENAEYFKKKGFATVIQQSDLNFKSFKNALNHIEKNRTNIILNMQKNNKTFANSKIIQILIENCKKAEK